MKKPKEVKYSELASYARITIRKLSYVYYNELQSLGNSDGSPEQEKQSQEFIDDIFKELHEFLTKAFGKENIPLVKDLYHRYNDDNDIEAFHEMVERIKSKGFKNHTIIQDITKFETVQQVQNENQKDIYKLISTDYNKGK